ncbi:MAG TPA: AbrB/MazE/SpoVT family DNA-binding domain-containing protein [Longimicrobium sp.]|jgi:antitoxin MazE|uniref:AbrB/MazE/SpoVT family DNA-binding domain-containing protein n=1 Tax=Longimicrobium sp. TaxID=2029185 RepID=UPI002EDAEA60
MKARIVRIGNSHGIRIPKPLLEKSGLRGKVEMEVRSHQIIIQAVKPSRAGWDAAFQGMAEEGDDALLDPEIVGSPEWDGEEWEW